MTPPTPPPKPSSAHTHLVVWRDNDPLERAEYVAPCALGPNCPEFKLREERDRAAELLRQARQEEAVTPPAAPPKPTAGPWTFKRTPHPELDERYGEMWFVDSPVERVAETTSEANATLIARAPDLLAENERLRDILTQLLAGQYMMEGTRPGWFTLNLPNSAWAKAEAALTSNSSAVDDTFSERRPDEPGPDVEGSAVRRRRSAATPDPAEAPAPNVAEETP